MSAFLDHDLAAGVGDKVVSVERELQWSGLEGPAIMIGGKLATDTVDARSASDTSKLQPGLVLGKKASGGEFTNYDPAATDGSEVAVAILGRHVNMKKLSDNAAAARDVGSLIVGGHIKSAQCGGLDGHAKSGLAHISFDDQFYADQGFRAVYAITSSTTIAERHIGCLLTNRGASGTVTLTLPTIDKKYFFYVYVEAAQTFEISGSSNIVAEANASASTAGTNVIGRCFKVIVNDDASKWLTLPITPVALTLT